MIHIPQNFYRETIAQDVPLGTGNIYVSVKPTVASGWATISSASSTLREIVYFSSTGSDGTGDYIVIANAGDRGLGGTTEQTHIIGEPIRMNVIAETIDEISDALDAIVAAGAQDASTSTKGIVKLNKTPDSPTDPIAMGSNAIVIETTAGVTHSLTTIAGQVVVVWAKGVVSNNGGAASVTLKYNTVTKDTITTINTSVDQSFSLIYTETPGAATANITVETSYGSLSNVKIIVMKIG
jgi:hypothetical protein